jgi:hypothetical protein
MTKRILYTLLTANILLSCTSAHSGKEQVEGTYVNHFENEFSKAQDTVTINAYNKEAGTYFVIHRTAYQRINNGHPGTRQFKEERSIGVWNDRTKQLTEQRRGRIYSFPSTGDELLLGSSRYQKVE